MDWEDAVRQAMLSHSSLAICGCGVRRMQLAGNRFLGGLFCGSQGITGEIPVVVDSLSKWRAARLLKRSRPKCCGIVEILPSWAPMGLAARYATMMDAERSQKIGYAVIG
jgi:hypothetical protein